MTEPHPDHPIEGFYRRRLVKGGPFIPVHIARFCLCSGPDGENTERHIWNEDTCDRFPPLTALVQGVGEVKDAAAQYQYCYGQQIKEKDYKHLLSLQDWAEEHAPTDPYANTNKPIDHMKVKSLF